MWVSQIRLSDDVISSVRELAVKRRLSINRTIEDLVRDQLAFLSRCSSGQYKSSRGSGPPRESPPPVDDGYVIDTSYSQV